MLETIATISVSLVVGYWLGTPTTIETETHTHTYKNVEEADYVTISGVSGGGATGGSVRINEINAENVKARSK